MQLCQVEAIWNDKLISTKNKCLWNKEISGVYFLITLKSVSKIQTESIAPLKLFYDYYLPSEIIIDKVTKPFGIYSSLIVPSIFQFNEYANHKYSRIYNLKNEFTSNGYFVNNFYGSNIVKESNLKRYSHRGLKFDGNFNLSFVLKSNDSNISIFSIIITLENGSKFQLFIDNRYGIILKSLNPDHIIDFYYNSLRTLFIDSAKFDIIYLNNIVYLSSESSEGGEGVKLFYKLEGISSIDFDIENSFGVKVTKILRKNFFTFEDLFKIYEFKLRASLNKDVSYIEYLNDGDICAANGKNRKTIVEYRCDESDTNDANIESINEEDICVYKMYVKSRYLCSPFFYKDNIYDNFYTSTECQIVS